MNEERLRQLLQDVKAGEIEISDAIQQLRRLPFDDLGFARLDTHRAVRTGFPEVVYCAGKTIEQVTAIVQRLAQHTEANILATRATEAMYDAVKQQVTGAKYYPEARIIALHRDHTIYGVGKVLVITGGTSDIPVAEEAAVTAEMMGNEVERLYDVGVAGLHRLLSSLDRVQQANVLITVAGMEGALASVVSGLVNRPVVAVPTSVGYGANFGGLSALLTMLNSCASGVTVVNIDNGFGAGYAASLINRCPTNGSAARD